MHNIKIKTSFIRSGIVSFCLTMFLVLVFVLTLSVLEIQTQGRILRAENQIKDVDSGRDASGNVSSFCVESVTVVCSQLFELRRLAVREVGF
jgi:hypothetical protein